MKKPDLIPCPFCGSAGRVYTVKVGDTLLYAVECVNEECEVHPMTALHDKPQQAADVWNQRAPS